MFVQIFLARQKQDALMYTQQGAAGAGTSSGSCLPHEDRLRVDRPQQRSSGFLQLPPSDNSASPLACCPSMFKATRKTNQGPRLTLWKTTQVNATLFFRTQHKLDRTQHWTQFSAKQKLHFTGEFQYKANRKIKSTDFLYYTYVISWI